MLGAKTPRRGASERERAKERCRAATREPRPKHVRARVPSRGPPFLPPAVCTYVPLSLSLYPSFVRCSSSSAASLSLPSPSVGRPFQSNPLSTKSGLPPFLLRRHPTVAHEKVFVRPRPCARGWQAFVSAEAASGDDPWVISRSVDVSVNCASVNERQRCADIINKVVKFAARGVA